MRIAVALVLVGLIAGGAAAQPAALDVPLPRDRPVEAGEPALPADAAAPLPRPRPDPEPADEPDVPPEASPPVDPRVYQAACPALLIGRIEAEVLDPIDENGCGERSPLVVSAVLANGRMVPLSGTPTLTCSMASVLPDWIEAIDGYAAARENTRIARVLTGTSYACRNRNNAAAGDLSEHGFANALDVVGFELEDRRTMTLPDGWIVPVAPEGRLLRFAHDAACARFTTTLGPEANALHADHLHVDLGCHGQSCTARLCE